MRKRAAYSLIVVLLLAGCGSGAPSAHGSTPPGGVTTATGPGGSTSGQPAPSTGPTVVRSSPPGIPGIPAAPHTGLYRIRLIVQAGTMKKVSKITYQIGVNDTIHDITDVPVPWQLDGTVDGSGVVDLDVETGDMGAGVHCFIVVDGAMGVQNGNYGIVTCHQVLD